MRIKRFNLKDAYKILTSAEWQKASENGFVVTELDTSDGFIHLSTASQLAASLSFYFKEYNEVVLLQLKGEDFKDEFIFEEPSQKKKRTSAFPHLYSQLDVNRISEVWHLKRGGFILPDDVLLESEN